MIRCPNIDREAEVVQKPRSIQMWRKRLEREITYQTNASPIALRISCAVRGNGDVRVKSVVCLY